MIKICTKCKELKNINEFYKKQTQCKSCFSNYYKSKKNEILVSKKVNKDHINKIRRLRYKRNPDKIKLLNKTYRMKLSSKIQANDYHVNRRKIDINYKLSSNLRTRLYQAIKRNYKSGSAVRDLGCSIEQLKIYLEAKFQPDMSWDNYGKWHIDHILPLSKFNLTDRGQLCTAVHFTNLQPLWAEDNLKKHNR